MHEILHLTKSMFSGTGHLAGTHPYKYKYLGKKRKYKLVKADLSVLCTM